LGKIDEVPVNAWQPLPMRAPGKADFRPAIKDFYLTNPIARASATMQRCSAELLHGVDFAEAAE
jgi:NADH-quinone oxidoreductase subunit G